MLTTTDAGMGRECLRYHSRLAELIATKKGEQYAKTMSWIRRKSFVLEGLGQKEYHDIKNADIEIDNVEGAI